jgi:hypothetical protein
MTRLLCAVAVIAIAAACMGLSSSKGAISLAYGEAGRVILDTGRCFNRCVGYRAMRPATMRVRFCSWRCQ